jgi:hypothetical protein
MLQVSVAAGSAGGVVASGGVGSVVGAAAIGSVGVAGAGSDEGEHAISAAPAASASNVFFMAEESRAAQLAFK